jgi:hypothetical protein
VSGVKTPSKAILFPIEQKIEITDFGGNGIKLISRELYPTQIVNAKEFSLVVQLCKVASDQCSFTA